MIPDKFQGRLIVDNITKSIILRNVTKSDAGYYTLERNNGHGGKEPTTRVEVRVLDLVWIHKLVHNETDRTISLTLGPDEDLGTINWKIDGEEDLLVPNWQSHDTRTLTIAYNHTGVITVNVSNLVSADGKSITLMKDLNGYSSHLDYIMYPNIAKLIWDKDGGHTDNGRHNLSRNISNIGVLIPSDERSEPPSSSHNLLALIAIPVMLCFIILVVVLWKKGNKCQKQTAQDRHKEENQLNEMADLLKANDSSKNVSEAAITSKDPEKTSIDETTADDAKANNVDHLGQTISTLY